MLDSEAGFSKDKENLVSLGTAVFYIKGYKSTKNSHLKNHKSSVFSEVLEKRFKKKIPGPVSDFFPI